MVSSIICCAAFATCHNWLWTRCTREHRCLWTFEQFRGAQNIFGNSPFHLSVVHMINVDTWLDTSVSRPFRLRILLARLFMCHRPQSGRPLMFRWGMHAHYLHASSVWVVRSGKINTAGFGSLCILVDLRRLLVIF